MRFIIRVFLGSMIFLIIELEKNIPFPNYLTFQKLGLNTELFYRSWLKHTCIITASAARRREATLSTASSNDNAGTKRKLKLLLLLTYWKFYRQIRTKEGFFLLSYILLLLRNWWNCYIVKQIILPTDFISLIKFDHFVSGTSSGQAHYVYLFQLNGW